jgi:hypothetical protein
MQPLLAFLAFSFVLGLALRAWNFWVFSLVGMGALVVAMTLYGAQRYM